MCEQVTIVIPKTVLVTGAAGFIGSHVCERLLTTGYSVVGVDNFDPFYSRIVKLRNLEGALSNSRFCFHEINIQDRATLTEVFQTHRPEVAVHLAAYAGVRPSIERPLEYVRANVDGTATLLDVMQECGTSALLFGSSSSVYGTANSSPFREDQKTDSPLSPYAATKKACEVLNHVYYHLYGISVINLRFFTVYGPRQRPDLAIHKFTRLIDQERPLPFYGDGSSFRDYTYIDDILDGIGRAVDRVQRTADPIFETYNLGESRTISLTDLIVLLEERIGKSAILDRLPAQPGDMPLTYADISAAKSVLGYDPKTPIEVGLDRFIAWYRANRDLLVAAS